MVMGTTAQPLVLLSISPPAMMLIAVVMVVMAGMVSSMACLVVRLVASQVQGVGVVSLMQWNTPTARCLPGQTLMHVQHTVH